jgi:hypothetical protein
MYVRLTFDVHEDDVKKLGALLYTNVRVIPDTGLLGEPQELIEVEASDVPFEHDDD